MIHGDYYVENVFFNERKEVSNVFDFEKAEYAPRFYELFRSLFYTFFNGNIEERALKSAKLYLRSYIDAYPMNNEEISSGFKCYLLHKIHNVWAEHEHVINQNYRISSLVKLDYERVKYISEHSEDMLHFFLH